MFDVTDFGACGDGVTDAYDAISACFAACATAGGGEVVFPRGTYLTSGTLKPAATITLHFQEAEIVAKSDGDFVEIGPSTGYHVLFDTTDFQRSMVYGRVVLNCNSVASLVAVAVADDVTGNSANVFWGATTQIAHAEIGLYGQGNVSGFIGWHIASVQMIDCGYDIYGIGNSMDDAYFAVTRSQGSDDEAHANKQNIYLEDVSGITFSSLYVNAQRSDRKGILFPGSLTIAHLFMEGVFDEGVETSANRFKLIVGNLQLELCTSPRRAVAQSESRTRTATWMWPLMVKSMIIRVSLRSSAFLGQRRRNVVPVLCACRF